MIYCGNSTIYINIILLSPLQHDDSDDDSCALSENWTFQQQSRRWSRVGETGPIGLNSTAVGGVNNNNNNNNSNLLNNNMGSRESTPDR